MNKDVREYLIEVARGDEPTVYYSELVRDNRLKIDLGSLEGPRQVKTTSNRNLNVRESV